jgi:hypothetical protein
VSALAANSADALEAAVKTALAARTDGDRSRGRSDRHYVETVYD